MTAERTKDRNDIDELAEMLYTARERAHWLAVHRRMRLAGHIERGLDVLWRLTLDLRGRHARDEHT